MLKKLLTLSLVAVMLSVSALANTDLAVFTQTISAEAAAGLNATVEITANNSTVENNSPAGSITLTIDCTNAVDAVLATGVYEGDVLVGIGYDSNVNLSAGSNPKIVTLPAVTGSTATRFGVKFFLWEKNTLVPQSTVAQSVVPAIKPWDGKAADSIVGGTGTEQDPYLISDGAELAKFASLVNDGETTLCAKLDADIYLNNFFEADGVTFDADWYDNSGNVTAANKNNWGSYMMTGYAGTFDGDGHSIYGMYLNPTTSKNGVGLFAKLAGTVKNVKVLCGYIKTGRNGTNYANFTGMLAGQATAAVTIDNVITSGKITANTNDNCYINNSAGILANNTSAGTTITDCESHVDIISIAKATSLNSADGSSSNVGVGGIVGLTNKSMTITSCKNYGDINVPNTRLVGGILGCAKVSTTTVTITDCANIDAAITAYDLAGQIAGYIQSDSGSDETALNADTSICKGELIIMKPATE